jgi:hypothetical protein
MNFSTNRAYFTIGFSPGGDAGFTELKRVDVNSGQLPRIYGNVVVGGPGYVGVKLPTTPTEQGILQLVYHTTDGTADMYSCADIRIARPPSPPPFLDVKLRGAAVNPLDDTFVLEGTLTNVGAAALDNVHLTGPLEAYSSGYPLGSQGAAALLAAPTLAPVRLAPGASTAVRWTLQADEVGYIFFVARAEGTAAGVAKTGSSGAEVKIGDPQLLSEGEFLNYLMGIWYETAGAAQEADARIKRSLGDYLRFVLKPFKKKSKVAPNAAERTLALAMHWSPDALGWMPDGPGEWADISFAALKGTQLGPLRTIERELGNEKQLAKDRADFLTRTFGRAGMAELGATGAELFRMARNGELTGGLVGDSYNFYKTNWNDPVARDGTMKALNGLRSDTLASIERTADKVITTGKADLKKRADHLQRDPAGAVQELSADFNGLGTKGLIEYGKMLAGDKVLKSAALLRRLDKVADAAEEIHDGVAAERRVGEVLDNVTPGLVTAAQMEQRVGLTVKAAAQVQSRLGSIEQRYAKYGLKLELKARPLSSGDLAKVKAGFIPKIEAIPLKKVNAIDVQFLKADRRALNEVGWFEPRRPSDTVLKALGPSQRQEVLERYALRKNEYAAMLGNDIDDKVLQKKVETLRRAATKGGARFEEKIAGKTVRTTELKVSFKGQGNVNLVKSRGLKINGRAIGRAGAGFTGDWDIESLLTATKNLPPGIRGAIELEILNAFSRDADLPFGLHGWGGFDLSAVDPLNTQMVMREKLARLPRTVAEAQAAKLAKTLGCKPDDLLGPRRTGFVITFTRDAVTQGPP